MGMAVNSRASICPNLPDLDMSLSVCLFLRLRRVWGRVEIEAILRTWNLNLKESAKEGNGKKRKGLHVPYLRTCFQSIKRRRRSPGWFVAGGGGVSQIPCICGNKSEGRES